MNEPIEVELTPTGCRTPEGIARVNAATAAVESGEQCMATAGRDLVDALRSVGYDGHHGNYTMSDALRALRKEWQALDDAATRWRDATEEFLRAVCGKPSVRDVQQRLTAEQEYRKILEG